MNAIKSCSLSTAVAAMFLIAALPDGRAATIDLGSVSPLEWSLISVGGKTVTVNNESVVRDFDANGDNAGANSRQLGIQGVGGKLQMSGGGYIGGPVRVSDGTSIGITTGNILEGGIVGTNVVGDPKGNTIVNESQDAILNQAANDLVFHSGQYAQQASTITGVTSITDTLTLAGASGMNVINLSKLELGGGEVLTLDGGGFDSSFVINIFGDLKLNSGRVELTGGLTFDEVLFNVIGGKVAFSGGGNSAVLAGVILALDGETAISPGLIQGSIFGRKITLTSGADLDTPFTEQTVVIPIPATLPLLMGALLLFGLFRNTNRRRTVG